MQTIRLRDPFRGHAARRLEWGSSEWAADSCLAEWSTFERQWLGPMPNARGGRAPGRLATLLPGALRAAALVAVAAGCVYLLAALPTLLPA